MLCAFHWVSRNDPYIHYRRFYHSFRKMVKYQWFVENRPTHFAAYRLPSLPNFVRKRRVFTEPLYPFYSLSASDEVGARPSLPNFVRKREYFTNNLNKVLQNHWKNSHWNPLNNCDYKPLYTFLFSILFSFSKSNQREPIHQLESNQHRVFALYLGIFH